MMDEILGNLSLEAESQRIYDELDEKEIQKLITKGRKAWTYVQKETITVNTLTEHEIQLCNDDPELGKIMILQELLKEAATKRIDEIIQEDRELAYTITDKKGVRVDLEGYDLEILRKCCEVNRLELEEDSFNNVAYIRPLSKSKRIWRVLGDIRKVLQASLKKGEESDE